MTMEVEEHDDYYEEDYSEDSEIEEDAYNFTADWNEKCPGGSRLVVKLFYLYNL